MRCEISATFSWRISFWPTLSRFSPQDFDARCRALFSVFASAFASRTLVEPFFAPTARHGPKHFRFGVHQHRLLLGSQYQRAPVFIGRAERGEDPLAETEIGLAVMRALDRAREGECCPAKT